METPTSASKTPATDSPSDPSKPSGYLSRLTGGISGNIPFFNSKGSKEGSKEGGSKDNLPSLAPAVTPDGSKKTETGSKENTATDKKTTATGDDTGNNSDSDKKRGQKNNSIAGGGPGNASTRSSGNKSGVPSNLMPKILETTLDDTANAVVVSSDALGAANPSPAGPYLTSTLTLTDVNP